MPFPTYSLCDYLPSLASSCDSAKDRLDCLREIDADVLDKIVDDIAAKGPYGAFPIQPVIDGSLIRERPLEALEKRQLNTVCFPFSRSGPQLD